MAGAGIFLLWETAAARVGVLADTFIISGPALGI
jgi:hypothetical protein